MENQQKNLDYNYEFSKSNRARKIIIFDKQFILNLNHSDKEGNKRLTVKNKRYFINVMHFHI